LDQVGFPGVALGHRQRGSAPLSAACAKFDETKMAAANANAVNPAAARGKRDALLDMTQLSTQQIHFAA
jgi:hypothetical protein